MVKKTKFKGKEAFVSFKDYIDEQHTQEIAESEEEDLEEPTKSSTILTKQVKKVVRSAKLNTINSLRKLLGLYRSACHTNDENPAEFENPDTYNLIIISSCKIIPKLLKLNFKGSLKVSATISYKNVLRSFLSSTLYLLKQVSDKILLSAIFRGLAKIIELFEVFSEYTKKFVKTTAKI